MIAMELVRSPRGETDPDGRSIALSPAGRAGAGDSFDVVERGDRVWQEDEVR